MENVTVKDLASEFELRNSLVISELKKIGVWVPSPETPVDTDIANRIRKRLQMLVEADQEEKEKKTEKVRKASPAGKVKRSIRELGKPRKRVVRRKPVEEEEKEVLPPSPLSGSMKPRKGRKAAYRRPETVEEEELPKKIEITIDDEPLIERVEAKAPQETVDEVKPEEKVEAEPEEAEPVTAETEEPQEVTAEVEVEEVAETVEEVVEVETVEAGEEVETVESSEVVEVVEPAEEAAPEEVVTVEPEEVVAEEKTPVEERVPPPAPKPAVVQPIRVKKKKREKIRKMPKAAEVAAAEGPREIVFAEKVTVKTFAELIGARSNEVIQALMQLGMMVNMNQVLDQETISKVCEKFEVIPNFVTFEEATAREEGGVDRPEDLTKRAPVVTVMGHVDHGKTSLLDYIRHTRVAEGEAGGITQHIGAYRVKAKDQHIVFIDTPGHAAFTRMRARGAQATDVVVLVVAADDGVMPQTIEAIDHAKAAGVPIVVAINKIDKAGSQPDRVKQELNERGLIPEDWGGDTVMVEVSAVEGTNIELLLEMILLVTDLQDLKANSERSASGVVLEAGMEKGRGVVATLLVQNGTLSVGDNFIAGSSWGRIRAMFDDQRKPVRKAGPSTPIEILGLQGIPLAGDVFQVVDDQTKAREMVEFRQEKQREQELTKSAKVSLDELYAKMTAGEVKELPVVVKGDTQGSVEVLEDALNKLSGEKVKIDVIRKGVGAVTEYDVLLASASNAIVIGFNVRPEASARTAAENEGIEVRLYRVIYNLVEDIEQAMVGLLEPDVREKYLGRAEVRETFRVPKVGVVAGSYVQDGLISRNAEARLLRDNVVVYEGRLGSLKRFKDDVNEVRSGYECGISIADFNDVKIGDVIEVFVREEVAPQLN
jgi:translation initiation factor IF-2